MSNKQIAVAIVGLLALIGILVFASSRIGTRPKSSNSTISVQQPQIRVGDPFPEFDVTEVDGTKITTATLLSKPSIVWFTTSWCVPCQIGAQEVSKLDDALGGKAFDVLVIFVDLQEKPADLTNWRKNFAREDWMVAFDNELTQLGAKVNLQFLDSKFLLSKDGVIKDINFEIADQAYLNLIKHAVKEN